MNGISADTLVHVSLLAFIGFLSFVAKKLVFDPLQNTQRELIKHVDECNKIPKTLILEKLENMSQQQKLNHEAFCEFRDEVREETKLVRQRYHNLNNAVQIMIGKSQIK